MADADFEICPFRPEWEPEVLALLAPLWGGDAAARAAYHRWKYPGSPWAPAPLGIVARAAGRVVGFRGYFAQPFAVPGLGERVVLVPGDTCVDPAHRRAGLSIRMGHAARAAYEAASPLLLNLSATPAALPGYQELGFRPLAAKHPVVRATPLGTVRYLLSVLRRRDAGPTPPEGRAGTAGLEASATLPVAAWTAIRVPDTGRIRLARDARWLGWRYANPRGRYRFYLLRDGDGGRPVAAAAIGCSAEGPRGHLLDLVGESAAREREIVAAIVGRREFAVLSIAHFAAEPRPWLAGLGFRDHHAIRALERHRTGEVPVLVRLTAAAAADADFLLGGLDVRRPASWDLTPIASDAV